MAEEPKKPHNEAKLADFYNNETLSDIVIVNPLTHASYKSHKIILSSGSKYFLDLFTTNDASKITMFEAPKAVKTSGEVNEDSVSKLLKFLYNNQDFSSISGDIKVENATHILSQAYVMKMDKLVPLIEKVIVDKFLKPDNCTMIYLESIKFQSKSIGAACENLIATHLAKISQSEQGSTFLKELPAEQFKNLCSADNLCISNEKIVVDLIESYLQHRDELPPLDEEIPKKDYSILTEEEKKKREEEEKKKGEEEKKQKDEEEKKQNEEFAKLDELGKIQTRQRKIDEEFVSKCEGRLTLRRLTKEQKTELFKTIRYGYLKHEELLDLTLNPVFDLAKNFIVQGLSMRLDTYENAGKKDFQINVDPRVNYELNESKIQQDQNKSNFYDSLGQGPSNLGQIIKQAKEQNRGTTTIKDGDKQPKFKTYEERKKYEDEQIKKDIVKKGLLGGGLKDIFGHKREQSRDESPNKQQVMFGLQGNKPLKQDIPHQALSQSMILPQSGPKPPQKNVNKSMMLEPSQNQPERPTEFLFDYDFDENGALYFLGSYGKKRVWSNPHLIGQVQAFASSIGAGTVDLFSGRVVTNCRTLNEPFSYYGVDLGEGRQLLPSCYTIRNRNSTTHVLLNWHFEGSNDKSNWTILDRRIYLTNDPQQDHILEEDQKHLKQKGATSTWGVDTDVFREIGFDGFRFFRIIQVGKNSSGSDNLALSGFELYGKIIKGKWP